MCVCVNESESIAKSDISRIQSFQGEKKRLAMKILHCNCTTQYSLVYIKHGVKIYTASNKSYFDSFMKDQRDLTVKKKSLVL